jgi:hypothetical protein
MRRRIPADPFQVRVNIGRRQIGDTRHMYAGCPRDLGQIHAAELSSADQPHTQGFTLLLPPLQKTMKIHDA